MLKDAYISADEKYRYWLTRVWMPALPRACWIMLNPSTADAYRDDRTIIKCIKFSNRFGYGGLTVLNLFNWRATDPEELYRIADPVGPEAERHLMLAREHKLVICAWGIHGDIRDRDLAVLKQLRAAGLILHCLGETTKGGHPRHPLYLPDSTGLSLFDVARSV